MGGGLNRIKTIQVYESRVATNGDIVK